jgi:hypothetical protein
LFWKTAWLRSAVGDHTAEAENERVAGRVFFKPRSCVKSVTIGGGEIPYLNALQTFAPVRSSTDREGQIFISGVRAPIDWCHPIRSYSFRLKAFGLFPVDRVSGFWTNLISPARPIGRTDKFFEMGGHSLLALQALRQIENKLGVRLDFRVLFQESLADIATKCCSERFLGGASNP